MFRGSLSHNLAVREYNPTPTEQRNDQASDILINWLRAVLIEFNIDLEDILTSSTDSGSDIKRALEVVFKTLREWCTSHLLNLSLVDAFGTCVDKNKSKNKKAREIFSRIRRFVEFVNKSGMFKAVFDENVKDVFERFLKLHNSPQHRWSAMEDVLNSLMKLWDVCITTTRTLDLAFDLIDLRDILIEFLSIIHPVRNLQKLAQSMRSYVCANVYIHFANMLFKVLDSKVHLEIHDPTSIPFVGSSQDPKAKVFRKTWDLNLLTGEIRDNLLAAMSKRFYNRYHPLHALRRPVDFFGASPKKTQATISRADTHFSYLLDMQTTLCPDLRDGALLKKMIMKMSTDIAVVDLPRGSIDVAGVIDKFYDLIHDGVIWKIIKR